MIGSCIHHQLLAFLMFYSPINTHHHDDNVLSLVHKYYRLKFFLIRTHNEYAILLVNIGRFIIPRILTNRIVGLFEDEPSKKKITKSSGPKI